MKKFFQDFARDEGGVAMVEYALIAGLVSVVAIVALASPAGVGFQVEAIWQDICDAVKGSTCT